MCLKKNFLFFALLMYCVSIQAQHMCIVKGIVMDKDIPLEFVNVYVTNNNDTLKIILHTTTDSTGNFTLKNLPIGTYKIRCSMIDFQSANQNFSITPDDTSISLQKIILQSKISELNAIRITANKKTIEKTKEGFVVHVANNITQAGGTATDILKNTPAVAVDADGIITLRGKTPLILINGKISTLSNPNIIPASSIESLEIITNASAKYSANAESGIINIRLKKNKQNGLNGSLALGIGYGAKPRISSSTIINYKIKKWNIGASYDNRLAGRTKKILGGRTNFNNTDIHELQQTRNDKRLEQLQNIKLNVDYFINDKNTISIEAIGNLEGQDNNESLDSKIFKSNQIFNSNNNRTSLEIERNKVAEYTITYERKFKNEKKLLNASVNTSYNWDRQNTGIVTQNRTENNTSLGNEILEHTHNCENEINTDASINYTFPIFKKSTIETGYALNYRATKDDFETSEKIGENYIIDITASNIFKFS